MSATAELAEHVSRNEVLEQESSGPFFLLKRLVTAVVLERREVTRA